MCKHSPSMQSMGVVSLDYEFSTIDILRYLLAARTDAEISWYVAELNRQGKSDGNRHFNIRFDPTIASKNVRRRIFITRPVRSRPNGHS